MVALGAQLLHDEHAILAVALIRLACCACVLCASLCKVPRPACGARGSSLNAVLVVGATRSTRIVPNVGIIPTRTNRLFAGAIATISRRARGARCARSLRAAGREGAQLARRALRRLVLRVQIVGAALVALRLCAIGMVARQASRRGHTAVTGVTDGAGLTDVIFREEMRCDA